MKFLHTADLHIGKKLFELSILEDQKHILREITEIAISEQVDAVVIAGDVYDRAVPSTEAVSLLDGFLTGLQEKKIPVIMISGNHDSPERVAFAGAILEKQGLHIAGNYQEPLKTVTLQDDYGPVHFVCMPFVKPAVVEAVCEERGKGRDGAESWDTTCAVKQMLSSLPMTLSMRQRYVLVTHYFVTGAQGQAPQLSDSETDVNVGGLDSVSASCFQSFCYVALGHIHRPQQMKTENENCVVAYSGAPLKYSFSEALGYKSVNIVELGESGLLSVSRRELHPIREMRCIKGSLADLMSPEAVAENQEGRDDYLQVTLTDKEELIDPIGTLRSVYPNVLQLLLEKNLPREQAVYEREFSFEKKSTEKMFEEFYELVKGEPLDEPRRTVAKEVAVAVELRESK